MERVASTLETLITRWRADPGGTYRSWFLWEERLKNFRSIRRGILEVIEEIDRGTFGVTYKGSSLETVVGSIAEQRQIFKGADHAFLWKPKLRTSTSRPRTSGRSASSSIPACAARARTRWSPRSATSISWTEYLAMREGILRLNVAHREQLSNDLGAVAGLLFDVGNGRFPAPPREDDAAAIAAWESDLAKVREETKKAKSSDQDRTHTEIQAWLRDLGRALDFDVWVAANDRARPHGTGMLGDGCLDALPEPFASVPGADTVRLIDVLWLARDGGGVAAAFEVEHTTSIYSGIIRLLDLALGAPGKTTHGLFLVAPDDREDEVRAQLARPAFQRVRDLEVRYLPYGELEKNREAIARFGAGLKAINAISRTLL